MASQRQAPSCQRWHGGRVGEEVELGSKRRVWLRRVVPRVLLLILEQLKKDGQRRVVEFFLSLRSSRGELKAGGEES